MNNSDILFYIVVPVYKAEKFIDKCISSVYNQSYRNWKLILVDDGSPDKSGEICDKYSAKDKNIITIHQENKGQIAARTTGNKYILENMQPNSFVVYLDSDDTLENNALEIIKNIIRRDNSDMVIYQYQRVYPDGKIDRYNSNPYTGIVSNKRELYKIVFSSPYYNSLCIKSISSDILEKNEDYSGYYNLRHGEDLLQSIYYYKYCNKVSFIDKILYNYNFNDTSVTNTINYDNYELDTTIREEVLKFLESENVWNSSDYKDYARKMQKLLENEIKQIGSLHVSNTDKLNLYRKMEKNTYWDKIISYGASSILILLFKLHLFRLILFILNIYYNLRKI